MEKEIEKIPIDEAMEMLKEVGVNVNQEDAELNYAISIYSCWNNH